MSRTFKLDRYPYSDDEQLYMKRKVTIEPGLTILVGCNGSAKTTLLTNFIKPQLQDEGIPLMHYNNLHDGGNNARQAALSHGRMELLATLAIASEGEQIRINIEQLAGKIGKFVRDHKDASEIWLLFDALDSGFSIDNIIDIKEQLFATVINHSPNTDIYIIVAANSYEMARGEQCLDVRNCKYVTFKTYDAYRKFILKSRALKDARFKEEEVTS